MKTTAIIGLIVTLYLMYEVYELFKSIGKS
jgi:hypothetical protein